MRRPSSFCTTADDRFVVSLRVVMGSSRAGDMCCHGPFWKGPAAVRAHAIPEQVLSNQVTDGSEQLPRQV